MCEGVLDFWQEHEPDVYRRIAETAKYREGNKIEFGLDIEKQDDILGTGSHFEFLGRPQYVTIATRALSYNVMLDRTGMARRSTLEDTAYHELCHAGDSESFERIKTSGLTEKFENGRAAVRELVKDCLKSDFVQQNPGLQKSLRAIESKMSIDALIPTASAVFPFRYNI